MRLLEVIKEEIAFLIHWVVMYLPNSHIGTRVRLKYWRSQFNNQTIVYIGHGTNISGCDLIQLGDRFMLGDNAVITVADSDPVYIGNNVALSEGGYLRSANHGIDDWETPITLQEHTSKKIPYKGNTYSIVIEDDVWMAAHTVILTGAFIGKGSVVSAGAVVSSEIPPYSIVVGNPARAIANRKKLAEMKQDTEAHYAKVR